MPEFGSADQIRQSRPDQLPQVVLDIVRAAMDHRLNNVGSAVSVDQFHWDDGISDMQIISRCIQRAMFWSSIAGQLGNHICHLHQPYKAP